MDGMDNTKRLIAFLVLSIGLLFAWSNLFPPPPPVQSKRAKKHKATSRPTSLAAATSRSSSLAAATSRPTSLATSKAALRSKVAALPALPRKEAAYKHDLFTVRVSNYGGGIVGMQIHAFREPGSKKQRKPLEILPKELAKMPPFSERFLDETLRKRLPANAFTPEGLVIYDTVKAEKDGVVLRRDLTLQDGGVLALEKRIQFQKGAYDFRVTYRMQNRSTQALQTGMSFVLTDFVDPSKMQAGGFFSGPADTFEGLCLTRTEKAPIRSDINALKKKPQVLKGDVDFVAVDRRYFMMALMPAWKEKGHTLGCSLQETLGGWIMATTTHRGTKLEPQKIATFELKGFLGPKYYQKLAQVGHRLDQSIDFGIFAFISKPMLWFMQFIYTSFGRFGNWGIAIILLTVFVKLLLWIPTTKQMLSMKKMTKLGPELQRLKSKYGDDKESLQRETMALYTREGINPLGGCLPMLIQMPIWIALYNTLFYAVELYQAPFIPGWIDDLSMKDPFYITPVILGASMFLQQKMSPTTGMDEAQAKMLKIFMPIFFTAIMLFLPSGLTLYILVNTGISILHQWIVYNQPDVPVDPKKVKPNWLTRMNAAVEEYQKLEAPKKASGSENNKPKRSR